MTDFFPLQLLLATFAGWVNREQAEVVAYLVEETPPSPAGSTASRLRSWPISSRRTASSRSNSVVDDSG
jgi:hypothetical protein